jgi:medium-chain acyl-[acyl-carrier-protein] hydrolase
MSENAWLVAARPNPNARLRLLCLPPAGGGELLYRQWHKSLPDDVEVCAVRLPGRDRRLAEPPFSRMTPLVRALVEALAPALDRPYALFGHSVGARVAFELARALRCAPRPPSLLAVSGRAAPQCPERQPMRGLSDDELIGVVARLGGTPEAVLREPELLEMFLPIIRADVAVNEEEPLKPEAPLDCPIVAIGGATDERCTASELAAWREHTRADFSQQLFPGGHFYLQTAERELLGWLGEALRRAA